jgi:hypothetical protein
VDGGGVGLVVDRVQQRPHSQQLALGVAAIRFAA